MACTFLSESAVSFIELGRLPFCVFYHLLTLLVQRACLPVAHGFTLPLRVSCSFLFVMLVFLHNLASFSHGSVLVKLHLHHILSYFSKSPQVECFRVFLCRCIHITISHHTSSHPSCHVSRNSHHHCSRNTYSSLHTISPTHHPLLPLSLFLSLHRSLFSGHI